MSVLTVYFIQGRYQRCDVTTDVTSEQTLRDDHSKAGE